jgi:hypothetical protein
VKLEKTRATGLSFMAADNVTLVLVASLAEVESWRSEKSGALSPFFRTGPRDRLLLEEARGAAVVDCRQMAMSMMTTAPNICVLTFIYV